MNLGNIVSIIVLSPFLLIMVFIGITILYMILEFVFYIICDFITNVIDLIKDIFKK